MATTNRAARSGSDDGGDRQQTEASTRTLFEHGREMRAEGEALLQATQTVLRDVNHVVGQQIEVRPYATLGTAFGLGLLLGGGLPFGVVRFTARIAAGMFLRQAVEAALPFGPPRA
jgi:hypothetical protein